MKKKTMLMKRLSFFTVCFGAVLTSGTSFSPFLIQFSKQLRHFLITQTHVCKTLKQFCVKTHEK